MSLIPSFVQREIDTSGTKILTYNDGTHDIQAVIVTESLAEYGTNDIEEASSVITYVGKEKLDGAWLIMKIDTTSGTSIRYANIINNSTVATYTAAWAIRNTTLVYGLYSEIF